MTSDQDTQIIILLGVTLFLAILFELGWTIAVSRLQNRRREAGTSVAENTLSPTALSPAVSGWIREWDQRKSAWAVRWKLPLRVIGAILLGAILILAIVPSWLVFQDRWSGLKNVQIPLTALRCKLPLLCSLELPPYFLFLMICLSAAGLLMVFFPLGRGTFRALRTQFQTTEDGISGVQILLSRGLRGISLFAFFIIAVYSIAKNRMPGWALAAVAGMYIGGWFLREISFPCVWQTLRKNQTWLIACGLAHIALVATLAVFYSAPSYVWLPLAAFALGAVFLFRVRKSVPPVYWIFSLALVLFTININSWWVSVAGDEYGFFVSAQYILEKTGIGTIAARLFDELGVYGQNPYLASIIQSLFLRVFGETNFGWRFSAIYPAALSILFFYCFFKEFLTRRVALVACFLLAISEYLIDFSKIGYVSLQALLAVSVSLAAAAWAVRSGRKAAFAATGAILALNFYSFGIAIVAIPLAGLLLLWYVPPLSRRALERWGVLATGFGLLVFPLVFQSKYWQTGFGFTIFGSFEKDPPSGTFVQVFFNRIVTSIFSYLYAPNESHFVAFSFVDGITAILVGIGFFAVVYQIRRARFASYFLLGWAVLLGVAGVIGSPELPSTTRMFVVLPWWAAAAALGLEWILDRIPTDSRRGQWIGAVSFGAILLAATGLNVFQATVASRISWADRLPFEAHVQQLAEATRNHPSDSPEHFVFLTYSGWSLDPFLRFQKIYPRAWTGLIPEKIVVDGSFVPESALPFVTDSRSVLIVVPTLPKLWQSELRISLQRLGEEWCPVYTSNRMWIYDLYAPKGMEWVCSVAG
jgi:hypothetical protein